MPCGDLLSLMPGFKQVYETSGNKTVIYQKVNHTYGMFGAYLGAKYSIKDEDGEPVTMNRMLFNAVKPLLLSQEYIADFIEWNGEEVDFNLDAIREMPNTLPSGCINRWPFYIWPDMATDLSKQWLFVPSDKSPFEGKIIINRTERYNNHLISYNFLNKYTNDIYFVGLPDEYACFCKQHKLNIPRYEVRDLLLFAEWIKSCKLYIGSQSSLFQICEGLKIPRLLEVCKEMPNVIGSGEGFYDFLTQASLEYYVNKLYNQ